MKLIDADCSSSTHNCKSIIREKFDASNISDFVRKSCRGCFERSDCFFIKIGEDLEGIWGNLDSKVSLDWVLTELLSGQDVSDRNSA